MKCNKPFGGLHVLLAGDFFQMKNVGGGSSIVESIDNLIPESIGWKGYNLLEENRTHYVVLTKNFRAMIRDATTNQVDYVNPISKICCRLNIFTCLCDLIIRDYRNYQTTLYLSFKRQGLLR